MARSIKSGSSNNTLRAVVYNTDGTIKTDLAYNTTGISIYVQKIGAADGSAMVLSAKSGTTWAAGAFLNLGGGDVSVDIADAVFTSYTGECRIYGTFTGGIIVGEWYPVVGYDPLVAAVGANTTAPDNDGIADILTRLPDAPPGAEDGLPILNADLQVSATLDSTTNTQIDNIEANVNAIASVSTEAF